MRPLASLLAALGLTLVVVAATASPALAQDATPPDTTASLDPAAPGPGGTYDGPVDVTLSASDPDEGSVPEVHEVVAQGFSWSPSAVDAAAGDTVNWDFNNGGHDVCLGAEVPDEWTVGECEPGYEELGDFAEGDEGGTRTFTQGEVGQSFAFYCSYHMPSMTGTVDVGEGGGEPGSGVDVTEYRVNTDGATGEWQTAENTGAADPFETTVAVSAEGSHVVEYRSTDVAGNVEETGSVAFSIEAAAGPPELALKVQPRSKRTKVNRRVTLTARLSNGGGPAAEVEVCAKAKSRLVAITGGRCWWLDELGAGQRNAKFTFKPKRAARAKNVRIAFRLKQLGGPSQTKTATLKVARR